jgi:hypothetical protein
LEDGALVAGTQHNLSNLYSLDIYASVAVLTLATLFIAKQWGSFTQISSDNLVVPDRTRKYQTWQKRLVTCI